MTKPLGPKFSQKQLGSPDHYPRDDPPGAAVVLPRSGAVTDYAGPEKFAASIQYNAARQVVRSRLALGVRHRCERANRRHPDSSQ
jgi:hypothetical protein